MKWIFILISEVAPKKNATSNVTPPGPNILNETEVATQTELIHEDNSTSSAIVGDLESDFKYV